MAIKLANIFAKIKSSIPMRISICGLLLLITAYYTSHLAYWLSRSSLKTEVFISPPNYMQGVQYYTDKADNQLAPEILANSKIKILVRGWKGKAPYIEGLLDSPVKLKDLGNGSFSFDMTLKNNSVAEEAKYLFLTSGNIYLLSQPFSFKKDEPPQIELSDNPFEIKNSKVKLNFKTSDDVGIASVKVQATSITNPELIYEEPIFSTPYKQKYEAYTNIANSRLSGKDVNIEIIATDFAGQETNSFIKNVSIPVRVFNNPEAIKITELYKKLEQNSSKITSDDFYAIAKKSSAPLGVLVLETIAYRFEHNGLKDEIMDNLWQLAITLDSTGKNHILIANTAPVVSPAELRNAINIFIDEIGDKIIKNPSPSEMDFIKKSTRKFFASAKATNLSEAEENYLYIIKSKVKFP